MSDGDSEKWGELIVRELAPDLWEAKWKGEVGRGSTNLKAIAQILESQKEETELFRINATKKLDKAMIRMNDLEILTERFAGIGTRLSQFEQDFCLLRALATQVENPRTTVEDRVWQDVARWFAR